MKKFTIVLLSMLLILSIGQAAFAKGGVDLKMAYRGALGEPIISGLTVGVSGEYPFTNWFTLSGGINADVYFNSSFPLFLEFNLDGKFTVLSTNRFNLGLQVILKDDLILLKDGGRNYLFIGAGIFADYDISEKFNIYVDIKSPFFIVPFGSKPAFAAVFDVILGAKYAINSKIDVGLEAGFNYSLPVVNFSIGAKVGYNF